MADVDMAEVTPIAVHTLDEAAVILRVKPGWLQRRAAARKIPFTMLGGAYHFTAGHIEGYSGGCVEVQGDHG